MSKADELLVCDEAHQRLGQHAASCGMCDACRDPPSPHIYEVVVRIYLISCMCALLTALTLQYLLF